MEITAILITVRLILVNVFMVIKIRRSQSCSMEIPMRRNGFLLFLPTRKKGCPQEEAQCNYLIFVSFIHF